jgi:beta-lactamase class A
MTLVMDGVRGSAFVAQPMVRLVRPEAPVLQPAPVNTHFRVGMDGIRRPIATPRDVLANLGAVPAMEPVALSLPAPNGPVRLRPSSGIAFSLVATALLTAGVATAANTLPSTATLKTTAVRTATSVPVSAPAAPVAAAAAIPADTGLQTLLNNFVAGQPAAYGIVVKNLTTGETGTINPDTSMESASLYKLFVGDTIFQKLDAGQLSPGSGAGGGSGSNVADCLRLMITISDNTCGRALGTLVGWGDQNAALNANGYTATNLAGAYPSTSPNDVAKVFERLYNDSLNSPSSNAAFLNLLKDQRVNNRLPVGLPAGTVMAHKTGDLDGFVHDAGIVYGPKTNYLIVVMSGAWGSPGNAPNQFSALSQQLWNHFQQ